MKLGCHVGNSGSQMLIGSVNEALSYGANCFMVYLGAPQNTIRKQIWEQHAPEMAEICKNNNIALDDVIIHAPYIVNMARIDEEKFDFAVQFLTNELSYVAKVGVKYMVLHPGSHVDADTDTAIRQIACGINYIFSQTQHDNTVIALETMAGKGNEVGRSFEEIKKIIDLVDDKSRIGVCLDTCHINDAGYDLVNDYENVLNQFDKIIGFEYLKVIHLNDSKNPLSSHKDRHENIGFGNIGFETIVRIANDQRFKDIPKILETPYVKIEGSDNSLPPYKYEIAMIKEGKFNPNLINDIIN